MKERGILFQAPLVRALLAGSKTQTRRLLKPQPPGVEDVRSASGSDYSIFTDHHLPGVFRVAGPVWAVRERMESAPEWCCPYGVPGDRLWVRETWATLTGNGIRTVYRADGEDPRTGWDDTPAEQRPAMRWRPSIYMPRSASRITLEVTEVRVQRITDITEEDALAEGISAVSPWVWAISFRRLP